MGFFFNDTATTEIYTLSLHDALPIFGAGDGGVEQVALQHRPGAGGQRDDDAGVLAALRAVHGDGVGVHQLVEDRKSTRLNSSHANISYAVFCLKKKNKTPPTLLPLCL